MRSHGLFSILRKAAVAVLGISYVAVSFLAAFDVSVPKAHAADIWYPGGWTYRQKITFDNSGQAENLAQFPVMVRKTVADTDFWSHALSSCADVRFADSNGYSPLAYEIEECDSENGNMIAWVNVPQINASSSTDYIYLYYGNSGASSAENSDAVWNSGYAGVWHLNDGNDVTINDSSGNGQNGTATGVAATGGFIDGGATIADGDYVDTGASMYGKPAVFTLSGWIKPTDWGDSGIFFSSSTGGGAADTHWGFFGRNTGFLEIFTSIEGGAYTDTITEDEWNNTDFPSSTWNHIAMTVSDGNLRYFRNGVQVGPVYDTAVNSGTAYPLYIGVNPADSFAYTYEGDVDEVQLSTVARSSAWIAASYLSETDAFNTFGSEEAALPGVLNQFVFDTIATQSAGQEFSVTMNAVDAFGDPVAFTGTVDFSALSGAVIPTTSDNFIAGVLTQNITVTGSGAGRTITAAATGGDAIGISNEFDVGSDVVDHFVFAAIGTQTAGNPFTVTVTAKDQYNNTVTDFTGPIHLTTTAGTISPEDPNTVIAPGVISEDFTVTLAGSGKTITASYDSGAVVGTSDAFSVSPGAFDHLGIAAIGTQSIGTPFDLVMTAYDAYENVATDFIDSVDISVTSGAIDPVVSGEFSSGTATESVTISDYVGDGVEIGITPSSNPGVIVYSDPFTVSPGGIHHFTIDAISDPQMVEEPFDITITAYDEFDNLINDFAGSADLSASIPMTPGLAEFSGGVAVVSVSFSETGTTDITATEHDGGIATGISNSFTIDPRPVSYFEINAIADNQYEGFPFDITITAKDDHGNTAVDFTGTVEITTADGTFTSDAFTAGVLSGQSITITTVDASSSVSVFESVTSSTGTSNTFAVHADTNVFYFNNAVDTSPSTLGNYWIDEFLSVPAPELPGVGDELHIGGAVIYNGNAVFYGNSETYGTVTGNAEFLDSSENKYIVQGNAIFRGTSKNNGVDVAALGEIEGNAEFYNDAINSGYVNIDAEFNDSSVNSGRIVGSAVFNDDSYNNSSGIIEGDADFYDNTYSNGFVGNEGTFHGDFSEYVSGAISPKTRYYTASISPTRDFVADGPWTIVSDGAGVVVNLADATWDENTILDERNGGSFAGSNIIDHFVFASIVDQVEGVPFEVVITAKNSLGQTVTDYSGTLTFSSSGGHTITPALSTNSFIDGVLTESISLSDAAAGGIFISVDDGSGHTGDSDTFDIFLQATTYTLTGPSSGTVGDASSAFTVSPNNYYDGTVTITPSGGGLSTPIVLTFTVGDPETFTITPTVAGIVTLTPTNSGALTDPAPLTYTANALSQPSTTAPPGAVSVIFLGGGGQTSSSTAPVSPTSPTSPAPSFYVFRLSLKPGQASPSVRELQKYLNRNGFFVAKTGPGSIGKETNFFGAGTRAALTRFQEAHAADILIPLGLTRGTGILGPSTIRYINTY